MAEFVDFTNATELEKFTLKLSGLMKEKEKLIIKKDEDLKIEARGNLVFREVDFMLEFVKSELGSEFISSIPHFRFDGLIERISDLEEFWVLKCVDKGRTVSEATGRLLLGALIQVTKVGEAVFVRIGEVGNEERFLGFKKGDIDNYSSEFFETQITKESINDKIKIKHNNSNSYNTQSSQITLQWRPGNLKILYPGFSGYFDSWHPIEIVEIKCIWPQLPRGLIELEDVTKAPIWLVSCEESESILTVPLRNSTLRSIQAGHLRELLFTPMGSIKLFSIPRNIKTTTKNKNFKGLKNLFEKIVEVYREETENIEKEMISSFSFNFNFSFVPKRILETMRWDRLNEIFSEMWRQFIKTIEKHWNNLEIISISNNKEMNSDDIFKSLKLINWCIKRELEWQESFKQNSWFKRNFYNLPERHFYKDEDEIIEKNLTVDEKIARAGEKLKGNVTELNELIREDYNELIDKIKTKENIELIQFEGLNVDIKNKNVLQHDYDLKGHAIYIPETLNCEPPPNKLLTKSLLKNPISAGEVIALNQLKEDIRAFKAWNEEICGIECGFDKNGVIFIPKNECDVESIDLGFIGFLLWHSPNDIEPFEGVDTIKNIKNIKMMKISSRMKDPEGQWLQLWNFKEEGNKERISSLNKIVSYNHRALLGQVISDLALQTDLRSLMEIATPDILRLSGGLMGSEAIEIISKIEKKSENENENESCDDGMYPFEKLNKALDEFERQSTHRMALGALSLNCPTPHLISNEQERLSLLGIDNNDLSFKIKRFEVVKREIVDKKTAKIRHNHDDDDEICGTYMSIVGVEGSLEGFMTKLLY